MQKLLGQVLTYLNWHNSRRFTIKCLFITIALSMSVMAYKWADQFDGVSGLVVFCAFIAFDIVLVPRFPNWVHFTNSVLATFLSVAFMILIGYQAIGSSIAKKDDPTYATLLEKLEFKQERIAKLESDRAAFILSADSEGLNEWRKDNGPTLDALSDEYELLLDEKQQYNADSGGSFQDSSVAPIKWAADELGKTPEQVTLYVMIWLWVSVLSIQIVLSAASHDIRIHRPTLMRGLGMTIAYILDWRKKYIEDYSSTVRAQEDRRDVKKTKAA